MLNDRTRGILMQVAFKEACEDRRVALGDAGSIQEAIEDYFLGLIQLFEKYDIKDDDSGSGNRSMFASRKPTVAQQVSAPIVEIEGVEYYDFREAKAEGVVKENHPDFKTVEGARGKWLTTKDGEPTQFAATAEIAGV